MGKKNVGVLAVLLLLSLTGCHTQTDLEVPVVTPTPSGVEVSYKHRDFEDEYYHFQMKTPVWSNEKYAGTTYGIERGGGEDDWAMLLIGHYNEEQESNLYDTSRFDTPEHVLDELQVKKVERFMKGRYDMTLNASDYTTTECQVAGLDAVKYEGTYTFEITQERVVGVTGYCILGEKTHIFFCVIDMSDGQDKLDDLSALMDEMASTFQDSQS